MKKSKGTSFLLFLTAICSFCIIFCSCAPQTQYKDNQYIYVDGHGNIAANLLRKDKISLYTEKDLVLTQETEMQLFDDLESDYNLLDTNLKMETDIKVVIISDEYILSEMDGSVYNNGLAICNLEAFENKSYLTSLAGAYLNTTETWKQVAATEYFFGKQDYNDMPMLKEYYEAADNHLTLSLFQGYFNKAFASEETICTHYYQLIRSNLKSFINGKLISSLLSSILIVLSSTFIYTLTMILTGHPIGDGRFSYEGTNLLLLKHLVENNHYWLHYMCHILVFSVIATLSPWISLIASTFTKNRYIIFLAPFVVIRFLDVFGDLTGYFWIKPSHYRLSGTNIYELGMLGTFLYAFCFLAICQLIYRYCIRRKLRNG